MALSIGVSQRDMTLVKGRVVYNSASARQAKQLAEAAPGGATIITERIFRKLPLEQVIDKFQVGWEPGVL